MAYRDYERPDRNPACPGFFDGITGYRSYETAQEPSPVAVERPISVPEIPTGETRVVGRPVVVPVPDGARRYRAELLPVTLSKVTEPSEATPNANAYGIVEGSAGELAPPQKELTLTPIWQRINGRPVSADSVTSTLIVEFTW